VLRFFLEADIADRNCAKNPGKAGRMKAGQLRATKVARTTYHGAYEGLGAAWAEFDAWIAGKGLTPELNRPLAG